MSDQPYVSHVDRRTALAWLAASGAVTAVGTRVEAAAPAPKARGYGTDPNLLHPVVPWPRTLTKAQLQTAALLCDFILPASATAPSASAVGVPDFIDEWVSAPYPEQVADRPQILKLLASVEAAAQARHGKDLFHLSAAERTALLEPLTRRSAEAQAAEQHGLFRKFHALTVGAYYTTKPGFKDIGYIGNVARLSDPGPSPEVKAHLERELKKLGL